VGAPKKPVQDDLFDLIKSLDAAEKGHFSRFAQRHVINDGNNYVQLFHLMSKMPAYDADAITISLKGLEIATPLAAAKNHLKSIVLKAMRDYYSGRTLHSKLLEGLENLAFFYEKKHYDLLEKEIKRLKKLATLHCEHHILFKIGDYERRLHKETAQRKLIEGMEDILSEMQNQARSFQNQLHFGHLLDKIFVIANKSGTDRIQAVKALLASEILSAETNAITPIARIYYHQIHAIAFMLLGELQSAQNKYEAVVSLWEAAPHLISESPSAYRRVLGNFLQISSFAGNESQIGELLSKIRNSPAHTLIDEAEIFSISYMAELIWRMDRRDWGSVAALVPIIEKGLNDYAGHITHPMVLAFQYHVTAYYFLTDDQKGALRWVRTILEGPRSEQRIDIQRVAGLMWLLLLWKKGDIELLEYELRSQIRASEGQSLQGLDQLVFSLVQRLISSDSKASSRTALETFLEDLSKGKPVLGLQVMQVWAQRELGQ
jgi:hypothetical protein